MTNKRNWRIAGDPYAGGTPDLLTTSELRTKTYATADDISRALLIHERTGATAPFATKRKGTMDAVTVYIHRGVRST